MSGTCPVCLGSKRIQAPDDKYVKTYAGYDGNTHTLPCDNCGGQMMWGTPTGEVNLNRDGIPCTHDYDYTKLGNCLHGYSCKHCDFHYTIDSGD